MNKQPYVSCVVVTYNRLELLCECLDAVIHQTRPVDKLIVIDNCSTDGTPQYLKGFSATYPQCLIIHTENNIGGAGGFSLGVKESVLAGSDYTWLMDDDTIPDPDALEQLLLVSETATDSIGFTCSKVLWTNRELHPRNLPGEIQEETITSINGTTVPASHRCNVCTFVSVLISSRAVLKVGLPVKEFFIWLDDVEYTGRLTNAGFKNYYVPSSTVVHKTSDTYAPNITDAPVSTAPRFYYQTRNACYVKHREQHYNLLFRLAVWNKYRILKRRIMKRHDGHETEFLDAVKRGCRDGLTFYPKIEYISEESIKRNKDEK